MYRTLNVHTCSDANGSLHLDASFVQGLSDVLCIIVHSEMLMFESDIEKFDTILFSLIVLMDVLINRFQQLIS